MSQSRWEQAQQEERACWVQHQDKINTDTYTQKKRAFWNLLMNRIITKVSVVPGMRVLDVGCGPSGAFLSDVLSDTRLTCIDPLMNEYLDIVPSLKNEPIEWVHGGIEQYEPAKKFERIFAFNSVDHARDISASLKQIHELLEPDGFFILSLNCHVFASMAALFSVANPILDPPHPHQHTIQSYENLIEEAGFLIESVLCVDQETHWINEETKDPASKPPSWKSVLKSYLSPQQVFFRLAGVLGYQRYGLEGEKKLYTHRVFICRLTSL
ncbi:class I SAM-dependent methyltransferase [Candidatus Uhrbacteria bacterium]|jgi:2-polyprenyl-3-methyl-5-hydroxy-6-metoxy-1,4-benzoquinol methylase|nr:class I SAM-dependent methyltransferase [Candidatus Uhrbacteria bacterium]